MARVLDERAAEDHRTIGKNHQYRQRDAHLALHVFVIIHRIAHGQRVGDDRRLDIPFCPVLADAPHAAVV
ncbi:MAG: hypothetical protein GDA53_03430 [Rhodobacteraceae bacterium]|nr:hypothetical protein [Paracoccaceae bacterium]